MLYYVIGLGSMGKRRVRCLIALGIKPEDIWGFDTREDRRIETKEKYSINIASNIEDVDFDSVKAIIVSLPPDKHNIGINIAVKYNKPVFVEASVLLDETVDIEKNSKNIFVAPSCTFMFHPMVKEIKKIIKSCNLGKVCNFSYHSGQYLPDWHPWESYKNFFVGNKKTNGIREILTIELPWIINTFGKIRQIHVSKNKITDLEVDYPDSFFINIIHENGSNGVLIIDLVSRKAVRNLEIINEDGYIQWDGTPDGLEEFDTNLNEMKKINLYEEISNETDYNQTIIENAYLEEIKDFFNILNSDKKEGLHSFEKDKYILDVIDVIEEIDDNKSYEF